MVSHVPHSEMINQDREAMNLTGSIPVMLETAATVVLLLLFSEALLGPLLADETNPESSVVLRLMWPPLYLSLIHI